MACGEYGPGRLPEPRGDHGRGSRQRIPRRQVTLRRQAHPRHRRADPRADRSGAGDRQPLVGPAGIRDRRGGRGSRRAGDAGRRPGRAGNAARRRRDRRRDRRANGRGGVRRAARRCRGPRRRRRRLAGRALADQAQEGRRPAAAEVRCRPATSSPSSAQATGARACSSASPPRPSDVVEQAIAKRIAKRADWIVANDVSGDVMGGDRNRVHLVTARGRRGLAGSGKDEVARRLIARIAAGARLSRRPCSRDPAGCGSRASSVSRRRTGGACPAWSSPMPTMRVDRQQRREAADRRRSARRARRAPRNCRNPRRRTRRRRSSGSRASSGTARPAPGTGPPPPRPAECRARRRRR